MRDWVSRAAMALVVLLLLSSALYALSGDQKALVGLKGVYVFVSTMDPETEHLGLSRDQIKTDVELRLRKAGVRVLTEEEWIMTPGEPALCVQVETFFNPADPSLTASFLVKVELKENVTVARGFKTNGSIWHIEALGSVGKFKITEIRKDIGDVVDKFTNDYLAANPK